MDIFCSTRVCDKSNSAKKVDFAKAILDPSAPFGGLYTIKKVPKLDIASLLQLNYIELTQKIFEAIGIDLQSNVLENALKSYQNFDDPSNPAPLTKLPSIFGEKFYVQELYHGPTRAFKDIALQPFGIIFSYLSKQKSQNKKYLIVTATSGDTGPATLESFANKEGISVVCLYPKFGTSDVQALQMNTQEAKNLKVIGIEGDFDDAQSILKSLLADEEFKAELETKNIFLSAANSVNFGRIAFQIIYHIWGYLTLVKNAQIKMGESIRSVIPSGNFGNALGAFYAKKMGLPIEKIVIASNPNNILSEFIQTGVYDLRGKSLIKSHSPAMDILKSSNIERVLFELYGANRTRELMDSLDSKSFYQLKPFELKELQSYFLADFCDDEQCLKTIKNSFEAGYLIDPHTATGIKVASSLSKKIPTIICSTAEWSKFAPAVAEAIFGKRLDDKKAIDLLCDKASILIQKNGGKKIILPECIKALFSKPIAHSQNLGKDEIKKHILQWL